jgi:hypothetical protein
MKEQLLNLIKQNPKEALDFYFRNNIDEVDYNLYIFDNNIIRVLTINGKDYEVQTATININNINELELVE